MTDVLDDLIAQRPLMKEAVRRVELERCRQVVTEGFTPEHDAKYHQVELARAAAAYVTPAGWRRVDTNGVPLIWPWPSLWWKPSPQTRAGRLRDLEKAGALILAEMERLLAKGGE
jgi:hypothetical protein